MVTRYWSADNLISQVSFDHNMMSYIKKYKVNQGCMSMSTYYLEDGRHLARLHRRRRLVAPRRRAYAPRAIPLAMITTRKSIHGFPLVSYKAMGLCLAARRSSVILKHVKAWLISSRDHRTDKTVFDLKQRCFYPRGSQKLTTNKIWYP